MKDYAADLMQVCAGGQSEDECNKYCSDDCQKLKNISGVITIKKNETVIGEISHSVYHCNDTNISLNPKNFQSPENYTTHCDLHLSYDESLVMAYYTNVAGCTYLPSKIKNK